MLQLENIMDTFKFNSNLVFLSQLQETRIILYNILDYILLKKNNIIIRIAS